MDIVLSSLILFLIISPGLLYNRFFYSELNYIADSDRSWGALVLSSLIPGLLIQSIGVAIISCSDKLKLRFDIVGYLITGCNDDNNTARAFAAIQNNYFLIIIYFLSVSACSILLAKFIRYIVIKFSFDRKYPGFFKYNEWWFYFKGRIAGIKNAEEIDIVKVDALVNTQDGTALYSGFLEGFSLNKNSIETLYLRNVIRWVTEKQQDGKETHKPAPIPGNYFIIPGKEILNFNLTYFQLKEEKKPRASGEKKIN